MWTVLTTEAFEAWFSALRDRAAARRIQARQGGAPGKPVETKEPDEVVFPQEPADSKHGQRHEQQAVLGEKLEQGVTFEFAEGRVADGGIEERDDRQREGQLKAQGRANRAGPDRRGELRQPPCQL